MNLTPADVIGKTNMGYKITSAISDHSGNGDLFVAGTDHRGHAVTWLAIRYDGSDDSSDAIFYVWGHYFDSPSQSALTRYASAIRDMVKRSGHGGPRWDSR